MLAAVLLIGAFVVVGQPAEPATAGEQVNGSGSTWSAIAVSQWQADVARQGLSINFNANGSSTGRKFYIQRQSDFAVSEIPFQPQAKDRTGAVLYDEIAQANARPYAYMPIVAGGTSFMYHLTVNGKLVRDLRLSGATIAKIFTGGIKNWSDPAITADDGRHFPSEQIKPVVRSDGSGTSAQFSAYMNNQFPDIWRPFCAKTGLSPCGLTSLYPYFDGSQAQQGSDGVASAVVAPYNEGAITYVEYGYAKQRSFPVVSVKNRAGYFAQPTAGNVAVALTAARINPDRTQVLDGVYVNPDKRAYPVSSYSYMIVPTTTAAPFTTGKGSTLGQFILYFLCTGQQKAEKLGYSPLPKNLVEFAFDAERRIPGAPAPPPINKCANPTITGSFRPDTAPPPPPDARPDAVRAPLTGGGGGGGTQVAGGRIGGNAPAANNGSSGAANSPGGSSGASRSSNAASGSGSSASSGSAGSAGSSGSSGSASSSGSSGSSGSSSTGSAGSGGGSSSSKSASTGAKASTSKGKAVKSTGTASTATASNDGSGTEAAAAPEALVTAASIRSREDRVPLPVYGAVGLVVVLTVFGPPALSLGLRRRVAARRER